MSATPGLEWVPTATEHDPERGALRLGDQTVGLYVTRQRGELIAASVNAVMEIAEKLECGRCHGAGTIDPTGGAGGPSTESGESRRTCPTCGGSGHPDPKQVAASLPELVERAIQTPGAREALAALIKNITAERQGTP
jgi:hypothetical protein